MGHAQDVSLFCFVVFQSSKFRKIKSFAIMNWHTSYIHREIKKKKKKKKRRKEKDGINPRPSLYWSFVYKHIYINISNICRYVL